MNPKHQGQVIFIQENSLNFQDLHYGRDHLESKINDILGKKS